MKAAFPPIVNVDSVILILGTMPGEESIRQQQYYANKGNHFWRLLFQVFGEPFQSDYRARMELLNRKRLALWDVLAYCERKGSLDSRIKNETANDFDTFFLSYPNISTVIFSSKAAGKYYEKYAQLQPGILYLTLPSPSGANAGKSFSQKLEEWKIIPSLLPS